MNTLVRALIEKTGREHGWENVIESNEQIVVLASARHRSVARIIAHVSDSTWRIEISGELIKKELARSFPQYTVNNDAFLADGNDQLALLLRRAAELVQSLPNQALRTYTARITKELEKKLPNTTEVERITRQRIGQSTFREALMDYWEGACAVTGISLQEILRASHAKPWAKCETDEERLDVYNGFLLCANLDALFDQGLITFDKTGKLICSSHITMEHRSLINLKDTLRLRWLSSEHEYYLAWHHKNIFIR